MKLATNALNRRALNGIEDGKYKGMRLICKTEVIFFNQSLV